MHWPCRAQAFPLIFEAVMEILEIFSLKSLFLSLDFLEGNKSCADCLLSEVCSAEPGSLAEEPFLLIPLDVC